jgi:phosphoribosyl-AMP cyclohydrolase
MQSKKKSYLNEMPISRRKMNFVESLDFEKGNGLIPTIVQSVDGKVLMLAYSSKESLKQTIDTGKATYYSRSRKSLWVKGESSGNVQKIAGIYVDCDLDTLLFVVEQTGAACHEGYESCFFRKLEGSELQVTGKKLFNPEEVYDK